MVGESAASLFVVSQDQVPLCCCFACLFCFFVFPPSSLSPSPCWLPVVSLLLLLILVFRHLIARAMHASSATRPSACTASLSLSLSLSPFFVMLACTKAPFNSFGFADVHVSLKQSTANKQRRQRHSGANDKQTRDAKRSQSQAVKAKGKWGLAKHTHA